MEGCRKPIGVFDSGMGGISVLAEAMRFLPTEDFLYYGDTKYAPYGNRQPEEVEARTHDVLDGLVAMGCKAIVIACNTATSVAGELRQALELPIIGMEPALKPASLLPGEGHVLVLGTQMTLSMPKFASLMERYGKNAVPLPCPGLVELVEAGETVGSQVDSCLSALFSPFMEQDIKAVVLGCTHFIFLREAIAKALGPQVTLVDGNSGTVRQLARRLEAECLLAPPGKEAGHVHLCTSAPEEAETLAKMQAMLHLAQHQAVSISYTEA